MIEATCHFTSRRAFLAGSASLALLAASGCATTGGLSLVDVIRRLLERATGNAFARLTSEDGFWSSSVARIGLPDLLGKRGGLIENALVSTVFREQLQRRFNRVAEDGARRAAPVVADAVRTIGTDNALAILKGGPQAATGLLRDGLAGGLLPVLVPALGDALRLANDPVLGRALGELANIDVPTLANALASDVDNAIWREIGLAEEQIRANPESTGDAELIAALRAL
jgi:Protein of unknown function (DUF4197)